MPTRREKKKKKKKKKLQNGQFSYVMWQLDMGEEHKIERDLVKTGHKKTQSSKQRAKKGPPKKKKSPKKKKNKKKNKNKRKVYIQKTYAHWKICVSSTYKRHALKLHGVTSHWLHGNFYYS
jgi:hypothetical protein